MLLLSFFILTHQLIHSYHLFFQPVLSLPKSQMGDELEKVLRHLIDDEIHKIIFFIT